MEQKKKQPSALSTWLEVSRFMHSKELYVIDEKHHINMVNLKGCSAQTLGEYVKHCRLSNEALRVLLKSQNRSLCLLWLNNRSKFYELDDEIIELIVKNLGVSEAADHGTRFSVTYTKELLYKNKTDKIKKLMHVLKFDKETEAMLLGFAEESLARTYYTYCTKVFCPEAVLKYNTVEIFEAFLEKMDNYEFSDEFLLAVFKTKKPEIVRLFCDKCAFSKNLQIALIDYGSAELVKIFLETHEFTHTPQIHLLKEGNDEIFYIFINSLDYWDEDIPKSYATERLFALQNREFLKKYLCECEVLDIVKEHLFQDNDSELVKLYLEHNNLDKQTVALISDKENTEKLVLEESGVLFDYRYLAELFKSEDNKRISDYLGKLQEPLYPFGEALLIKYADESIVKKYVEENSLSVLAQLALVRRQSDMLIECFISREELFDDEPFQEFIRIASPKSILSYLKAFYDDIERYEDVDEFDWEKAIVMRQDKELTDFLIEQSDEGIDDALLMKYALKEYCLAYIQETETYLSDEGLEQLVARGDKELILAYVKKPEFNDWNYANELLMLLDEEVITVYEELHGSECVDDDFWEAIGQS